jgi:CRISPR-associated protein Cas1
MNPLHLSGYGVKLRVRNLKERSELEIRDGRDGITKPYTTSFYRPRRFPYSSIMIDGHSGYISLQALHWLSKNRVPVFVMNFDGSVITSILPPAPVKADLRAAQVEASTVPAMKFKIAKAIVEAKIARSIQVLECLAERYDFSRDVTVVKHEALRLRRARTVNAIRSVEGRVALRYWDAYGKVLPESLDFQGRMTTSHQNNATDPVNAALNYGYGFLEGECRKAINTVGLEPSIGFLHETSGYQTKQSLVYDLQEPFRWIVDVAVIDAFESGVVGLPDFYFTGDDYRYRFEPEAKRRFLGLLRERFNSGIRCKGRALKWDTVIELKTAEFGRYLARLNRRLDLSEPSPELSSVGNCKLRETILNMSPTEARERGIGKSTFHYLRRNARSGRSFRTYGKVFRKLQLRERSRKQRAHLVTVPAIVFRSQLSCFEKRNSHADLGGGESG